MKNICVVTGSRAEYGIMKPLMQKLSLENNINLEVVVTAMHMEEKYGYTYKNIEEDGFVIKAKIPLNLVDTSKQTLAKSLSILTNELSEIFMATRYDLVIILGDRYEMLPVANVCLLYNIPICHIHGGEKTLGNFDESIRHAITKMSHLHLVSTEEFRNRVIQLGESPEYVYNIGAMGVENVLNQTFLSKEQLESTLNVELEDYYVVLFHPVTLEDGSAEEQMNILIEELGKTDKQLLFIGSNSDTDSDKIMNVINSYVNKKQNSRVFTSLTTQVYHSLVKNSLGLVGNSSSGLIEVPSLKVPTLNIGNRQLGRLSGESVINVSCNKDDIAKGLSLMKKVTNFVNPYEKSGSSESAKEIILSYLSKERTPLKEFYDIKIL